MAPDELKTRWRSTGPYVTHNASKTGLLEETRLFLETYALEGNVEQTRQALLTRELPQRSRASRWTILKIIQERLIRWNPPEWVLRDLSAFASSPISESLQAALLLHVTRQDKLLYDFVHEVIVPRWQSGDLTVARSDAQAFLDGAESAHPEISKWSRETREKLTGNMLSILRDYGLMRGTQHKSISEPVVPEPVVSHLLRLLQEEGVAGGEIHRHPDWQVWLWDPRRVKVALNHEQPAGPGTLPLEQAG